MESGRVDGLVAVVTGGASGIGRATCLALADAGAHAVVVADRQREPREGGEPTDALLGCESVFVPCDVSDVEQLAAAVAAADAFGGISAMCNVAGVIRPRRFLDVTEEEWELQMAVNAKGTFFGTQAAARAMVAGGRGGSVVNVSSVAGLGGNARAAAYSASKGAATLTTYAAAQALGRHGIRVNAVHPGMVDTDMARTDLGAGEDTSALAVSVPLGRPATPQDVAGAITYLCSPAASFVSGTSLVVDGGFFHTLH